MSRSDIHRKLSLTWSLDEPQTPPDKIYFHSDRLDAILQRAKELRAAAQKKAEEAAAAAREAQIASSSSSSSSLFPSSSAGEPKKVGVLYEEDGDAEIYRDGYVDGDDEEMEEVTNTINGDERIAYVEGTEEEEEANGIYQEGDVEEEAQPDEPPKKEEVSLTKKTSLSSKTLTAYQGISSEDSCDWSGRFLALDFQIKSFQSSDSKERRIEVNEALMRLASDFLLSAELYGKTIISEVFLSQVEKTIKPVSVGGVAGGEKFIIRNILFKFALDLKGLYQGDENAAKAAGHELKGVMGYHSCFLKNFNLPLMAIIDYRGFRLIAMSLLPIKNGRMIYGSADGGLTVHDDNPEFSEKMKIAAKRLNLAGHIVGGKNIFAAFDVEGHEADGKFYLLDLARTFPPELALKEEHGTWPKNAFLYRLMRSELVKRSPKPLCSDAGTRAQQVDPNWKTYNRDARSVKMLLRAEIIPNFGKILVEKVGKAYSLFEGSFQARVVGPLLRKLSSKPGSKWGIAREKTFRAAANDIFGEHFPLKQAIHTEGVNMRHMGFIVQTIRDEIPPETPGRVHALALVYIEMCARSIRKEIQAIFRRQMKTLRVPLEEPYRLTLVDSLNTVFGSSSRSKHYWTQSLKMLLVNKFGPQSFTPDQCEGDFDIRGLISHPYPKREVDGFVLLFLRLKKLMGFAFDEITENAAVSSEGSFYNQSHPFDVIDLRVMGARVKHMGVVNHARGYIYKMRGSEVRVSSPDKAVTILQKARENFEEVLESSPTSAVTLRNLGQVLQQIETISAIRSDPNCLALDRNVEGVTMANDFYLRAVLAGPNDTHSLYQFAQFLAECGELIEAEEYFLRSLEADPAHVAALVDYSFLLNQMGFSLEAASINQVIKPEEVEKMYPVVEPSLFHRKIQKQE